MAKIAYLKVEAHVLRLQASISFAASLFGPKLQKDPIAAHEKDGTMLLRKLLKSREGMRQWAG